MGYYADEITRLCVPSIYCNNTVDGLPTYGDQTIRKCVPVCPFNYFADVRADRKLCVMRCDTGLYGDDLSKQCVPKCPVSNKTYGSNSTNKCVEVCPFGEYA